MIRMELCEYCGQTVPERCDNPSDAEDCVHLHAGLMRCAEATPRIALRRVGLKRTRKCGPNRLCGPTYFVADISGGNHGVPELCAWYFGACDRP
jgi:hypothetical protein